MIALTRGLEVAADVIERAFNGNHRAGGNLAEVWRSWGKHCRASLLDAAERQNGAAGFKRIPVITQTSGSWASRRRTPYTIMQVTCHGTGGDTSAVFRRNLGTLPITRARLFVTILSAESAAIYNFPDARYFKALFALDAVWHRLCQI